MFQSLGRGRIAISLGVECLGLKDDLWEPVCDGLKPGETCPGLGLFPFPPFLVFLPLFSREVGGSIEVGGVDGETTLWDGRVGSTGRVREGIDPFEAALDVWDLVDIVPNKAPIFSKI